MTIQGLNIDFSKTQILRKDEIDLKGYLKHSIHYHIGYNSKLGLRVPTVQVSWICALIYLVCYLHNSQKSKMRRAYKLFWRTP